MPSFSQKLAQLMRNQGLGNRALAEHLGISHPPVGEWLKGKSMPRPEQIKKLADYFGVTVDDLLEDSRELTPAVQPEREPARGYTPEQRAGMQSQIDALLIKPVLKARETAERLGIPLGPNLELPENMEMSALMAEYYTLNGRLASGEDEAKIAPLLHALGQRMALVSQLITELTVARAVAKKPGRKK